MLKYGLRVMGSEPVSQFILDAMKKVHVLHVSPYWFSLIEKHIPEILKGDGPEIFVWVNPWATTYEAGNHAWQPHPKDMGLEEVYTLWDQGQGYGACVFDWRLDDWPTEFWLRVNKSRGLSVCVVVDDFTWTGRHDWWSLKTEEPDTYEAWTIPDTEKIFALVAGMSVVDMTNGDNVEGLRRFWEMFGRTRWHTQEISRSAHPGDHIYCTEPRYYGYAQAVSALRGCTCILGVPDGEKLVDPLGNLRVPIPLERL